MWSKPNLSIKWASHLFCSVSKKIDMAANLLDIEMEMVEIDSPGKKKARWHAF
jgi:hypothetical protein